MVGETIVAAEHVMVSRALQASHDDDELTRYTNAVG